MVSERKEEKQLLEAEHLQLSLNNLSRQPSAQPIIMLVLNLCCVSDNKLYNLKNKNLTQLLDSFH